MKWIVIFWLVNGEVTLIGVRQEQCYHLARSVRQAIEPVRVTLENGVLVRVKNAICVGRDQ